MDNNIEKKLTTSAREAIEEISKEINSKILYEANKIAQIKDTAEKEISLSDVLEAKENMLSEKVNRDKSENRRRRMIYLIGISGVTYAMVGLFIYVFQNKEFDLSNDLGLIIAGLGITLSIFAIIYQQLLNKKLVSMTKSGVEIEFGGDNYDIVKKWQVIEKLTRQLMMNKGYDENKSNSFNYLIKFLDEFVSDNEMRNNLRRLLKSRNSILHEDYRLDKSERTELLKFSSEMIDLLESELESSTPNKRA